MTAAKNIIVLLLLGLAGLGYWVVHLYQDKAAEAGRLNAAHEQELVKKEQEKEQALIAQADQHQKAIEAMNEDFEKKLDELRKAQRVQIASAYKEFESIFEGNKKTIDYIDLLEGKVKAGQDLSKMEVEKLAVITTGLGYLKKQYQKPMQEFSELQDYFEKQSATQPEKPRSNFFRRMFSREYREAEREFYREEGEKRAFEEAQTKFSGVYSQAQKQMAAVELDADKQLSKLYAFVEEKQGGNKEDLTDLFNQARKALRTHQEVLKFEPENMPLPKPQPQP